MCRTLLLNYSCNTAYNAVVLSLLTSLSHSCLLGCVPRCSKPLLMVTMQTQGCSVGKIEVIEVRTQLECNILYYVWSP